MQDNRTAWLRFSTAIQTAARMLDEEDTTLCLQRPALPRSVPPACGPQVTEEHCKRQDCRAAGGDTIVEKGLRHQSQLRSLRTVSLSKSFQDNALWLWAVQDLNL